MAKILRITAEEVEAEHQRLYSLNEMGLPEKIFDQRALSFDDLLTKLHKSTKDITKIIENNLRAGLWEQVWKRNQHGRSVKAYRPKGGKR